MLIIIKSNLNRLLIIDKIPVIAQTVIKALVLQNLSVVAAKKKWLIKRKDFLDKRKIIN